MLACTRSLEVTVTAIRTDVRMAGNFEPEVPTILNLPTFPLRRRSNRVKPTTPTFLSEPDIPPLTKPVVYSPVPTFRIVSEIVVSNVKNIAAPDTTSLVHITNSLK